MMEVDIRPRRGGKTTEMLNWYILDPQTRRIITINVQEADRLFKLVKPLSILVKREHFLTPDQVKNLQGGGHGWNREMRIAVDNADMVLTSIIGYPIDRISITED